ncbi:MAG: carboxypeptidase-like regulatory domain-containing protein [Propionibacterium sp.]|nr:carboxypeptidase-like regulatory domain-containing protein [Propionibacterium sp.]
MPRAHQPGTRPGAGHAARLAVSWLAGAASVVLVAVPVVVAPSAWADPLATPVPSASSTFTGSTALTMTASLEGLTVLSVSGALVSPSGTPMPDGVVSITVDDQLMGHATTGSDGRWSARISLPDTFPSGQHQVVALFLDGTTNGGVSASATVQKGSLTSTRLSATPSSTRVEQHQVLTVSGRLVSGAGRPVAAATIMVGTPDAAGTLTTGVTGDDGRFVIDYDVHEGPGQQHIPVRFDGDASGKASSTSVVVTVTDRIGPSPSPTPSGTATAPARAMTDSGPGDAQPSDPATPLPAKADGVSLTSGPLTSGPHLALGGVGLLALLTSLAMLGRSLAPRKARDERIRLIDR